MPSHVSSIGFPTPTMEDFEHWVMQTVEHGEEIATSSGTYYRWSPGSGAELWAQVDRGNSLIGLNPHFSGGAVMHAKITGLIKRPEDTILEGAFHAWSDPDSMEAAGYPFVFDTPDYALYQLDPLPVVVDVQLSAFAHELDAYGSEEEYYAAQTGELKYAAESFIPSGLFTAAAESTDPPKAYATFAGHVLSTSLLTNPAAGAEFHWARVRTLGGEVDVVVDPEVLTGRLVDGGIVRGSYWLSGRLLRTAASHT